MLKMSKWRKEMKMNIVGNTLKTI